MSALAALAWSSLAYLAATYPLALTETNVTMLFVAVIGAGGSITTAFIARGTRKELRQVRKDRRLIVTKQENGITISNEELGDLADE